MGNINRLRNFFLLLFFVFVIAFAFYLTDPFSKVIASKDFSIQHLNLAQRNNLAIACKRINGLILKPNQTFSFNQLVGPRTVESGFQEALSYLEGESPKTIGGGICVLSSGIYQLALFLDLNIIERFAHSRTISSVPPGLDATVWYGQADLKFNNNAKQALKFNAEVNGTRLKLAVYAHHKVKLNTLTRKVKKTAENIEVEVYKTLKGQSKTKLISRDLYRLTMK